MALLSPATDRVTESFYAFEVRGRGWTLAPYPVDLEPPHRPFFVLPDTDAVAAALVDDGKRPTLLSSLIDSVSGLFSNAPLPPKTAEAFVEQEPFPYESDGALVSFRVSVPGDFRSDPLLGSAIIRSLLRSTTPSAFEVIGHAGAVSLQLTVAEDEAAHVEAALHGFLPDATIVRDDDLLAAEWNDDRAAQVVDIGLANEFFLPLNCARSFDLDPLIPLIAALAGARQGELLVLQVLFQRTQNAWAKTIQTALRDDQGEDIFLDAPSFTTLAREKTASPILAVVLRIAACGGTRTRVGELLHSATSALRQFERGGGNAFIPLANDDYDDAVHAQALLRRESFRTGMLLSLDELAQLVHVPDRSVRDAALVRVSKRSKALPEHAQGHQHTLGVHVHRGTAARVSIATDARLAHTHMLGATGTGKSTLLLSLIAQDIAHGHPVFVLDPHGDLIEEVLARIPDERIADVCLFDPSDADADYPVGFNVLRAGSEVEQQLIASDLVAIFRRLATSWGDAMTTVLSNAVLALLEHPEGGTLVTLRRFLIDDAYRRQFLAAIPDREVRFFWEKEYPVIGTRAIGPILTRLDQFLRSKLLRRIVGQQSGKLDLGKMVDERRIVLCKLAQGAIGTENAHLLGSLLVSKLHQVALARQALPLSQRHSAYGYIDECQHFVSESMASLISEVRKYGVGFTFVHQSLAQLDAQPQVRDALLSIAHTRIMFRTGDDDAKKLAEGCAYFEASDLRSLARGEAIVRLGEAAHDFNLRVEPVEPVDEEIAEERRGAVRASSRARYATPRSELEDALPLPIDTPPAPVAPPDRVASTPLREPSAPVAAGTPPAPAPNVRRATRTAAAPSATTLGRGGKEHKYLQHLVKRLAEERGWRATIEDPGSEGASVDVVLRQGVQTVGVEISITTSVEHEIANLGKCAGLGFTRMLFIAKEPKKRERVRAASAAVLPSCPVDAIAPDDILSALDTLAPSTAPTETTVRGYTVRVSRQQLTPSDVAAKRKAVAGVIVRSLKPG